MYGTLFVRAGLTHWRSVSVLVLLGASVTGLSTATSPPEFHSRLELMAAFTVVPQLPAAALSAATDQPRLASTATPAVEATSAVGVGHASGTDERLLESRVRAFAQKATSVAVTGDVRRALALPYSADELGAHISASSPLDSTLIDIDVRDTDRERSARIATAVGSALTALAEQEKLPEGAPALKISLAVRQPATAPATADAVPWAGHLAGGALGGLCVGLGLALQRVLLRRRGESLRQWAQQQWHVRATAVRSLARLANNRFWGPGWR